MKLTDEDRAAIEAVRADTVQIPIRDRLELAYRIGKRAGIEAAAKVCEAEIINRPDDPLANSFDGGLRHCAAAIRALLEDK